MNLMICETCGAYLRTAVLTSNDEGPQEVEYSCPIHGPQWRWEYREWKRIETTANISKGAA